jgi:hypothetical protein
MASRIKEEDRDPSKLRIFLTLIGMCFLAAFTAGVIISLVGLIIGLFSK